VSASTSEGLASWSVSDVHESITSRSFRAAFERAAADADRLATLFDEHDIRRCPPRPVTPDDGRAADAVVDTYNTTARQIAELHAYVYASVTTNSRDEHAQSVLSEIQLLDLRLRPLLARLVDWVDSLGVESIALHSAATAEHREPLALLAARADHQMSEVEEGLYAELIASGSSLWRRLHADVTSQLMGDVRFPDGRHEHLGMAAVRSLASHADPAVRRAAYDAELAAWPTIAVPCAAALNGVKGEAHVVNGRRRWSSPLDASLFANSVSSPTFEAMQRAVLDALADFRRWMRVKARLHGHDGALPWWDLAAPLGIAAPSITWDDGVALVREAFATYGPRLEHLVDRALDERWLDVESRDGKVGGAFCMPFVGDRSLVLLNWAGSVDSALTTAHELGHAYHNVALAGRTPLQRRLPMALAETASIFCETLVVEAGLAHLDGADRLALLDVDLQGATQVVVDIHSRFVFESELFARRSRRTLGPSELDEMMLAAQATAYGEGLDQSSAHPSMWIVKGHYYTSHFYNWPYTFGLLFGLGLFARYRDDPDRFRAGYDDLLSRAGMATAEALGAAFGLDVTDEAFWVASLDVLRRRMADYARLADELRT
jgi:pepF/M3 family oligoendopeptidase